MLVLFRLLTWTLSFSHPYACGYFFSVWGRSTEEQSFLFSHADRTGVCVAHIQHSTKCPILPMFTTAPSYVKAQVCKNNWSSSSTYFIFLMLLWAMEQTLMAKGKICSDTLLKVILFNKTLLHCKWLSHHKTNIISPLGKRLSTVNV